LKKLSGQASSCGVLDQIGNALANDSAYATRPQFRHNVLSDNITLAGRYLPVDATEGGQDDQIAASAAQKHYKYGGFLMEAVQICLVLDTSMQD